MSLNKEDLRVGNFILVNRSDDDWYETIVRSITKHGINGDLDLIHGIEYSALEGIKLTEDLILDLGFKNNGLEFSGCIIYELGDYRVMFHKLSKTYAITHKNMSPPSWILRDLEYVHELQNFYFYSTKKELKYGDHS